MTHPPHCLSGDGDDVYVSHGDGDEVGVSFENIPGKVTPGYFINNLIQRK